MPRTTTTAFTSALNGLDYQLQISRELNPFSSEDHGYLTGLATTPPSAQQIWYGVFLRALNESHQARTTAASFDIRDTQGNVYYPTALDPARNQYVWTAQTSSRWAPSPPRHDGQLRAHSGQLDPVQAEQHGLRQPPAHARHPLRVEHGNDLARPLRRGRPLRASVGRGPGRVRAERDRRRARAGRAVGARPCAWPAGGPRRDPDPHRHLAPADRPRSPSASSTPISPGAPRRPLALLSSGGRPQQLRSVPHTRQVLALGYLAGSLQILGGTSGGGLACCTAIQTLTLGSRGFTAPRSLIRGLSGLTVGHLIASGTGELAVFAANSGVWAARAAKDGHFGAPHQLTPAGSAPQSLVARAARGRPPGGLYTGTDLSADPPATPQLMISTASAPGTPPARAAPRRSPPRRRSGPSPLPPTRSRPPWAGPRTAPMRLGSIAPRSCSRTWGRPSAPGPSRSPARRRPA